MDSAIDYLTAAVAYQHCLQNEDSWTFPKEASELCSSFEGFYSKKIEKRAADLVFRRLADFGLIQIREDRYAGLVVIVEQDAYDSRYLSCCDEFPSIFIRPRHEAWQFYRKAMASDDFWHDLGIELKNQSEDPIQKNFVSQIPASDRFVTLTHNSPEAKEIDGVIECIVTELRESNSIAEIAGADRDRLVAEGNASRDLLRGEQISWDKMRTLVLTFLKEVSKKFKDEAISWGVSKAIALISKLLGT